PAISPEPTKGAPQEKAPKGRRFLAALFGRPQEEAKPTAAPPVVETREPLRPVEAAPTAKPELQGVAETITPTEPAPPTKGKGKILHQGKVDLILPSTVDWRLTQKLKDDLEKMPTVKVEGTTGSAKGETVLTILLEEPLPIIEMLHALPEVAEIVRWEKPRTVLAAAREGRDTFPLRLTIGLREIAKEQPMITEAPPQELSSPPPLTPTRAKTVEAPPPITEILAGIVAQEPSVPGEPLQPPPSVAPGPLPVLEAGLYQGRVELQVTPLQNIAELMKFQTILATLPDVPGLSISDVLSLENGLGATFFLNLTMPIPLAATLVQSIPGIRLQKGPNRIVAELPEHW
ncbi:MAG: hypothetical protein M1136_07845, partial [Chloroflexi bacterium]|nr:hypothetical protein [Chloroflexota bacterium]